MLGRESWTNNIDSSGVKWSQVFNIYGGFFKKTLYVGFFAKNSIKVVKPPQIVYKGFKVKFFLKGMVVKSLLISSVKEKQHQILWNTKHHANSSVLIKKKKFIKTYMLRGLVSWPIKIRRFYIFFKYYF